MQIKHARVIKNHLGLYLEDIDAIVIADLHIGYELALTKKGIFLPTSQYPKIKREIEEMLEITGAKRVIINGDLKHEFGEPTAQEWIEVKELLHYLLNKGIKVEVVRGNHDNYIIWMLKKLGIPLHQEALTEGEYVVTHGHKDLEVKRGKIVVLAHEHPTISLRDRLGVKKKFKCFLHGEHQESQVIVLPAMSPIASGTEINEVPKEELLSPILKKVNIDEFIPIVVEPGADTVEFPKLKWLREAMGLEGEERYA